MDDRHPLPWPIHWWWGHNTPRRWGTAVHRSHPQQRVCPPGDTSPLHLVESWWERCWSTGLSWGHSCSHKNDKQSWDILSNWKPFTFSSHQVYYVNFPNIYSFIFWGVLPTISLATIPDLVTANISDQGQEIQNKVIGRNKASIQENFTIKMSDSWSKQFTLWLLVTYSELDVFNTFTYRSALS